MRNEKMASGVALLWVTMAAAAQTLPPQRVEVTEISVLGNTLLPQAQVDAALSTFKGRMDMDDLKRAARTLQALYHQAGYSTVVTFLPEQAVAQGRLVIGVLEGRIARIAVVGQRRFSAENIRRSVPALAEGRTPRIRQVDAQVQMANDNPAKKLAVTLEPGAKRGDIDATLTVTEQPVARWTLQADNTGSTQTGRSRLMLGFEHSALWGLDHQLAAQVQISPQKPGAVRVLMGSYRMPLYGSGLTVGLYGSHSNVDSGATSTEAGTLQFIGRGRAAGVSVSRQLERVGELDGRLVLSLERRDYLNDCSIEGLPDGACGTAGASVVVHPLSLEYTARQGGPAAFGFNLQLSRNLAIGGALSRQLDAVRPGATRDFTVVRGGFGLTRALAGGAALSWRLSAQASAQALVPGEQFGATGAYAVRGYDEREVTGDSGLTASMEWQSARPVGGALQWVAFADVGVASNHFSATCDGQRTRCQVGSVGVGTRVWLGASSWKLDLGVPLADGRWSRSGSPRVHVQAALPL